ncbi:MAG: hypothetical protein U1B77_00325, partial [Dehalococcoidales bacterium]|nr:hypothetical protein [Dehalococcoidales bacterium]
YSEAFHQPVNASLNWHSFASHKVIQLTGGSSHTVKIQYRTENAAGTAYIKNAALAVIEVTNYYTAEQETEITTTSTSYVDAVALNFSPSSQADYLMLVSADLASTSAGKDADAQWTIDGVADSGVVHNGTNYMCWSSVERENLTAASHTFKIQYKTSVPASAKIRYARITAVLASDLGFLRYAESEAESVTQSITYVDKTTLSYTASRRHDDINIASGLGKQENSSYAFYANVDRDGVSGGETVFVPGSARIYRSFMLMSKQNTASGVTTHKIQWKTNNAAANTEAFIQNANIAHLEINSAESYNDSAHTTVDDSFGPGENTAYIWAHGLRAGNTYTVAYYDGNPTGGGQKVATDTGISSTAYGNLSSQYLLTTDYGAAAATWHAVVFDEEFLPGLGPPDNYNDAATTSGYVQGDSFEVTQAAIPEFPTVLAAIAVAGTCFAVYGWMRKRRLAYVRVTP